MRRISQNRHNAMYVHTTQKYRLMHSDKSHLNKKVQDLWTGK